jgi:hypothetical protein
MRFPILFLIHYFLIFELKCTSDIKTLETINMYCWLLILIIIICIMLKYLHNKLLIILLFISVAQFIVTVLLLQTIPTSNNLLFCAECIFL